jgi:hypothetical protein
MTDYLDLRQAQVQLDIPAQLVLPAQQEMMDYLDLRQARVQLDILDQLVLPAQQEMMDYLDLRQARVQLDILDQLAPLETLDRLGRLLLVHLHRQFQANIFIGTEMIGLLGEKMSPLDTMRVHNQ